VPTAKFDAASIEIAAHPLVVYRLVSDISRMGDWSPECYHCTWLDDADAAVPGARFRGYNRRGKVRWQTTAVVTAADDGRAFAFTTVHDKTGKYETAWRYDLQQVPGGTLLSESYEFLWCPVGVRLLELPVPRRRQLGRGIRQTLDKIKHAAEQEPS
jgi:polyketide cyclase/dehydrase/lipid transport protein